MKKPLDWDLVENAARALVDPARRSTSSHSIVEITDIDQVKENMWEQQREFPIDPAAMERLMNAPDYGAELGWLDLRENMAAELHAWEYLHPKEERDYPHQEVYARVAAILAPNAAAMEFINDIAADLTHCAMSHRISKGRGGFWERILFVYEHGFLPCGWEGAFPDIRFIGYRFVR